MPQEEVQFETLNLQVPAFTKSLPMEQQREIYEYLNELDQHNRKGYEIAFNHLGSSFNISRSNGFKEWKKEKLQTKTQI